jgi:site-specific DNA recombinase
MVNDKESRRVRDIFALFAQYQSLAAVVAKLIGGGKRNPGPLKTGRAHVGRYFAKASLRRLLTNAIYAGKVEHRGAIYAGEQPSIVEPSVWQEVNTRLRSGSRAGTEAIRVPQNALLTGLLICKSCQRPMIPTYTAKPGRRYRYYVCKSVRQHGWSACPTKSVPASMIEDSVLDQLRAALRDSGTREQLNVPEAIWQSFEQDHTALVRGVVKEVTYEGTTGAVSLNLIRCEDARED